MPSFGLASASNQGQNTLIGTPPSLNQTQARRQIVRMHHIPMDRPRSKFTEHNAVGNFRRDWHIETKIDLLANILLHHAALDLIAKFVQQLFNALLTKTH